MKRSGRLRRRAKKPKPWKDAAILARFAETVTADELEQHLCGPVWEQVRDGWNLHNELHIHHIFHAGKRVDLWSNLVRCSAPAHFYCHKEPVGGVVACMWAVLERDTALAKWGWKCTWEGSMNPPPISDVVAQMRQSIREEWREAFGKDAVGWLQAKRDAHEVPEAYLDTVELILECF
jgi:hypothetical protein